MLHLSRLKLSGGADDAKPRWSIPVKDYLKYSYQPSIPDKHFFGSHWNYAPITMWLRARRPIMEKVGSQIYGSATRGIDRLVYPFSRFVGHHLPGFLPKVVAVFAAWFTFSSIARGVYGADNYFKLDKLHSYAQAIKLGERGFWRTADEEKSLREELAQSQMRRLRGEFREALASSRNFDDFSSKLSLGIEGQLDPSQEEILMNGAFTWRFAHIPYGKNDDNTRVFATPDEQQPGDAYQFMDAGDYGDYIDRKDNKGEPIRKSRQLFASAYIPPTK